MKRMISSSGNSCARVDLKDAPKQDPKRRSVLFIEISQSRVP